MKLAFEIDGTTVAFERHWFTGRGMLRSGTHKTVLSPPVNPFNRLSTTFIDEWRALFRGHEVVIEREQPGWSPAGWPCRYRIFVDGELVTEQEVF